MTLRYLIVLTCLLAFAGLSAQSTQRQYLSGMDKDRQVDWTFRIDRGMQAGVWTTIPVPSNWELEGFGVYNYGRGQNEPSNETGQYRHRFMVPESWADKVVELVFEGSMTDTEAWINGQSVGPVHQGSFYRFAYEVSDLLNYGEDNELEVTVKNWSANASVNAAEREADFWVFGGLFRPVYLEAHPQEHIARCAIDARADGTFTLDAYLSGVGQADALQAQIQTLDGEAVGTPFSIALAPGSDSARLRTRVSNPNLWSPEFPHRYRVRLRLLDGDATLHEHTETFGFRTVELKPKDGIYVNGQRVVFKGVNRHSAWPESGRTTSRALSIQDVELMKDMNMNAVRMSHYPPDKHFLEVTDSLGLFVIDELTGWQAHYDTEVGTQLVRELVTDDVNHPSIIMWANGNEGGFNLELDDDFHRYDPQQRPVIHPWATYAGTDTHHYIDYNCCAGAAFHSPDIFFPTEFLHGLYDGGHGAGLEDFWKAMADNPLAAGGFLWVFADEGVIRTDRNGALDTWGSNAPDGIVGPYREKEGSFFTIKELWSPVYLEAPPNMANFSGSLDVENRYLYTDLDQTTFTISWLRYPGPLAPSEVEVLHTYDTPGPSLKPGSRGSLQIDRPRSAATAHALSVEIADPHGRQVFTYVFPLHTPQDMASGFLPEPDPAAGISTSDQRIVLRSGNTEVHIDRSTGMLSGLAFEGKALSLTDGPSLDPHLGTLDLAEVVIEGEEGLPSASFHFEPSPDDSLRQTTYQLRYGMLADGWLRIDYSYLPSRGTYDYLGVNFRYPENKVRGIRWLGRGPYRVWKNRMKGPQLGVWQKAYNNTVTGESGWTYPEFKGYHADLHWALIDTEEMPFVLATETPGLFLRLFTPPAPEGAYNDHTDGVFPAGDLSLMHAISPIGTKFKAADRLGPMGQAHQVNPFRDKVRFQGTLYLRPAPTQAGDQQAETTGDGG